MILIIIIGIRTTTAAKRPTPQKYNVSPYLLHAAMHHISKKKS
jgi:hypothetical protein